MPMKIKISGFLQELHGEETTVFSIFLVYFTGIALGLFFFFHGPEFQSGLHRWLLAGIAADLGGGVVANMTQSTSEYYAKRPKTRWIFIFIHIIHPVLLWIIFPKMTGILFIGGTTLIFASIVNATSGLSNQRIVSAALLVFNLMLLLIFNLDLMALILLAVFSMKLIVGFAVRWTGTK